MKYIRCNAFINTGLSSFTGSYADWEQTLIYLCEMTFTMKKKTRNMLLGLAAVFVLVIAGVAAYKAMH